MSLHVVLTLLAVSCLLGHGRTLVEVSLDDKGISCFLNEETDQQCYHFSDGELTWQDSVTSCERMNGSLVTTKQWKTLNMVKRIMQRKMSLSTWIGVSEKKVAWRWEGRDDEGVGAFNAWGEDRPKEADSRCDCVMLVPFSDFAWLDMPCAFPVGYVCETAANTSTCRNALHSYDEVLIAGDRCFMVKNEEASWFKSREACERAGTRLATVNSARIQRRLKGASPGTETMVHGYWIGLRRVEWYWITGEQVSSPFWESGQPSRQGACAVMEKFDSETYLWGNWNCEEKLNFICELDITDMSSTVLEEPTTQSSWLNANTTYVFDYGDIFDDYDNQTDIIPNTGASLCPAVDVVFLMESPSSAQRHDWYVIQQFVAAVVSRFVVGDDCLRVAAVSNDTVFFGLKAHANVSDVLRSLRVIPWVDNGPGDVRAGLSKLRTHVMTSQGGARSYARHVIAIVANDDWSARVESDDVINAVKEAQLVREKNGTIVGVVVGDSNRTNVSALRDIVSEPTEEFILRMPDTSDLEAVVDQFVELLLRELVHYPEQPHVPPYDDTTFPLPFLETSTTGTEDYEAATIGSEDYYSTTSSSPDFLLIPIPTTEIADTDGVENTTASPGVWPVNGTENTNKNAQPGDSNNATVNSSSTGEKLGPYPVIAIALGLVAFVVIVAVIIFLVYSKRKRKQQYTDYDSPSLSHSCRAANDRRSVCSNGSRTSQKSKASHGSRTSKTSKASKASKASETGSGFNLTTVTTPWGSMGSCRRSSRDSGRTSISATAAALPAEADASAPANLFYNGWSIPPEDSVPQ